MAKVKIEDIDLYDDFGLHDKETDRFSNTIKYILTESYNHIRINNVSKKVSSLQKAINEAASKIARLENLNHEANDIDYLYDEKISKIQEKIDTANYKSIELLGIFTTIFTFITVSFQILKDNNDVTYAVNLVILLLGSIILFITLLSLVTQAWGRRMTLATISKNENISNGSLLLFIWKSVSLNTFLAFFFLVVSLCLIFYSVSAFNHLLKYETKNKNTFSNIEMLSIRENENRVYLLYYGNQVEDAYLKLLGYQIIKECDRYCSNKSLFIFNDIQQLYKAYAYVEISEKEEILNDDFKKHYLLKIENDSVNVYPMKVIKTTP